jgi:hypothetical protein
MITHQPWRRRRKFTISRGDSHPVLLGDNQLFEGGQCQGHEEEDKKDQKYRYTFGNRANGIDWGGVMLTAKP